MEWHEHSRTYFLTSCRAATSWASIQNHWKWLLLNREIRRTKNKNGSYEVCSTATWWQFFRASEICILWRYLEHSFVQHITLIAHPLPTVSLNLYVNLVSNFYLKILHRFGLADWTHARFAWFWPLGQLTGRRQMLTYWHMNRME